MDPDPHGSAWLCMAPHGSALIFPPDPDPDGNIFQIKYARKLVKKLQVYSAFKSKFARAPLFLTFEQSFMFFTTK